jgi:D-alanyl-D-alanine dipeptidase
MSIQSKSRSLQRYSTVTHECAGSVDVALAPDSSGQLVLYYDAADELDRLTSELAASQQENANLLAANRYNKNYFDTLMVDYLAANSDLAKECIAAIEAQGPK